ncbi:hypothetical protein [Bacillus mesophilum]|uniref:Uncharacterized protein n=1 Tax=Bacillus mesophilum TaxID=1071718 RepID=A0A7V7UWE3_9BACI|nr:hypothetical protein [Bacillus mesophilum]KAB2334281.1 hypothetical protein F7732_09430 [Bacillus mesophilum]
MKKQKMVEDLQKEYSEYMNEFGNSEFMDIDAHTRWSLEAGRLLEEIRILLKENEWLYGKLNQISDVIEKGRDESTIFVPEKMDTHPNT